MISEDLHFTHMWKTLTYLHHITKRGGCWPIKRVLPRHFSLKCLYQARGMSGHDYRLWLFLRFSSLVLTVWHFVFIILFQMLVWGLGPRHITMTGRFIGESNICSGFYHNKAENYCYVLRQNINYQKCLVISLIWFVLPRFVVVVWGFVLYFSHFVYYDGFLYYSLVILFLFFIFRQFWYDILVIWLICFTFRQFSTLFSNVAYFFFQNQLRSLISRNVSLLRIFKPN